MNTTILNYPGFQSWPRQIKRMLLASESFFFDQPVAVHRITAGECRMNFRRFVGRPASASARTAKGCADRARRELAAYDMDFGGQWLASAARRRAI